MREITGAAAVQGSQEWLDLRKNKRTASVCYTMCCGTLSEKRKLARQLQGLEDVFVSAAMERGTAFEDEARKAAEVHFGTFFKAKVYELGLYLASLDAIDEQGTLVEIKVPSKAESDLWKSALNGDIPLRYQYQMTMQYAVASASDAYLWVYLPEEKRGIALAFNYSPLLWDEIRRGCDSFWSEFMGDTMPDDPERTDAEWIAASEEYRLRKNAVDVATSSLETAKQRLIDLAGEQSAKGNGVRLTKVEKEGAIKYGDYCKKAGISLSDLEPYRGKGSISYSVTLGK